MSNINIGHKHSTYADVLPLIWNRFENSGYVTLFAEDSAKHGIFNEYSNGFEAPPTDHYMRPYWLAVEEHNELNSACYTGHTQTLDYVENFFYKYENIPKIAFTLLHATSLNEMTNELFLMLTRMKTHGVLDKTILLLMTGHTFKPYVTYSIEEKLRQRLPLAAFKFPPKFQSTHEEWISNIWINTGRLTTPYDLFHTLNHLLGDAYKSKTVPKRMIGQTLFEVVPHNRTCRSEGIDLDICSCVHWKQEQSDGAKVQKLAKEVVDAMNGMMAEYSDVCDKFTYGGVIDVKTVYRREKVRFNIMYTTMGIF